MLLQPLPYQRPGQLVRLYGYSAGDPDALTFVSAPHYRAYRADLSSFAALAATDTYSQQGADIGSGDRAERITILPVTADYFRVVGVQPALGRSFQTSEETDAPVVILSHRLWERLFHGRLDAVGASLTMSGVPHTICGIMPAGFGDPLIANVDAWVPQDLRPINGAQNPGNHFLTVLGRLRPGVTELRAQAELDGLTIALESVFPDVKDTRAVLVPLKDDLVGRSSRTLELMLGAVGLVLLLACVNVANLLLVRASERSRELALRAALGAGRSRLARQLLSESIVLAFAGGLGGLALGCALMPVISALVRIAPPCGRLTLDCRVLAFTCALHQRVPSCLVWLSAARADPRALPGPRDRGRALQSWGSLRGLSRTGSVLRTVPDAVLTFDLSLPAARYDSPARARFYENFARAVDALPGVRVAGGISRLPVTGRYHSWGPPLPLTGPRAGVSGRSGQLSEADNRVVSGDYFSAVGMRVLRGRSFDDRDVPSAPHCVVISASVAQQIFPGVDPIGQRLSDANIDCEVIGVVNDVAYDVEGHTAPMVYHAHRQYAGDRNWALTQVIAVHGDPTRIEGAVRRTLAALDPLLVMYQPAALDEVIGRGRAQRVFTLRVLAAFAVVALALAALGLFGVLSYTVRLRSKEIGIRMALGADRRTIRGMVLQDGARVTGIGVIIGLAASMACSRVIASVVFGVSPLDPLVLAGATAFLAIVATLAAYLPARRASNVAPQQVLQGQ